MMNAIRPEKVEATETETVDSNLAAVTEVEAGIRDFVRNDIAYLRRPAATSTTTDAPPLDPSAEATVTNVNSLIQRVAGTCSMPKASASSARSRATPSSARPR